MAITIAITNQKGGVGKTSTATALASGLTKRGYKTLLVDSDPQCNSTDTYRAKVENEGTLYDLLQKTEEAKALVQKTESGDIIACDPLLKKADIEFQEPGREHLLCEGLEGIQSHYDYIIIDTTPSMGLLLVNAIAASDYLIIPINMDRYSIQGLDQLRRTIYATKKYANQRVEILGILVTMYQANTNLTKEVVNILPEIEEVFSTSVFNSKIRYTVKVKEASAKRMPLFLYDPECTAAQDYNSVIDEIMTKAGENKNGKK